MKKRLLQEDVRECPAATIRERHLYLEIITGKSFNNPTVGRLLKRLGLSQKDGQWGPWSETNG